MCMGKMTKHMPCIITAIENLFEKKLGSLLHKKSYSFDSGLLRFPRGC